MPKKKSSIEADVIKFSLDCGRNKASKIPEFALILGSGASLLDVHEHRERLRKLALEDVVVIGVNYSYRIYIALQHVFLDWEMWSQNYYDLNQLSADYGVRFFCPGVFDPERVKNNPCVPLPNTTVSFNAFVCAALQCPHCLTKSGNLKEVMSDHWMKGLRGSATSVAPAINLGYLTGAKTVAIIGVEMDTARHYWQTERYMKMKDELPNHEKWHKMYLDVWGAAPDQKFPNSDYSLADLEKMGKYMKKNGRRAVNLAVNPPGAVKGWDRMTLDDLLTETERRIAKREYQKKYRKRKKKENANVAAC